MSRTRTDSLQSPSNSPSAHARQSKFNLDQRGRFRDLRSARIHCYTTESRIGSDGVDNGGIHDIKEHQRTLSENLTEPSSLSKES